MIAVRVGDVAPDSTRIFDASDPEVTVLRGPIYEHLLVHRDGMAVRLDVIEGTVLTGPVSLRFELPDDKRLSARLTAIQSLTSSVRPGRRHLQLARRLHALHAMDAWNDGASLRETADLILGSGDWPGDGECRKSHVRRMIATGEQMLRAGPRAILATGRVKAS